MFNPYAAVSYTHLKDAFIWFYDVDVIEGQAQKTITKVEFWVPEGVAYYVSDSEGEGWDLRLDSELSLIHI